MDDRVNLWEVFGEIELTLDFALLDAVQYKTTFDGRARCFETRAQRVFRIVL